MCVRNCFFVFASLAILCGNTALAQKILGPYEKYVSVQPGNDLTIASGSYTASADEGRYIDVQITNIQGPIILSSTSYVLTGPPCPTYDSYGNRTPSTPLPPSTVTFNGNVTIDPANIPVPGSKVTAQFTGNDMGYYTKCAEGTQVPMDSQHIVKFNINSIQLTLASEDLSICMNGNCRVKVSKRFPDNQGTVSWISVNGKFTVSGDNNEATLTPVAEGDDLLVVTFTVGQATFKDTAKVKVGKIIFAKEENIVPHYKDGTLDCNMLLAANSLKKDLRWRIVTQGVTGKIDSISGIFTFPQNPGATYVIEAGLKDNKTCTATTKVVMLGFSVALVTKKVYCDGDEAAVKVKPVPATVKPKELEAFGKIELYSEPKNNFNGNPANKKELDFDPLDANFNSKVKNCYWFSSELKGDCNRVGCSPYANHTLKAKAKVSGKDVFSVSDPELRVSIANPSCITGFTSAVQTFTGAPKFKAGVAVIAGRRVPVVLVDNEGTLKRDPKGKVTSIKYNANSQFKKFIEDEENYHIGQIEGKNGNICADLWLVRNVMTNLRNLQRQGFPNLAVANQAAVTAIAAENLRSNNLMVYPQPKRCALEKEAKDATGIKHGYNMECAYCRCVKK